MKPILAGNSHAGCVWRNLDAQKNPPFAAKTMFSGLLEEKPFSRIVDGRVEPTVDLTRERIEQLVGESHFSSDRYWAFLIGTHFIPFLRHEFWVGASICGVGEGRPISEAMIREAARGYTLPVFAFFRQLAECGVRFSVVSGPPPRLDRWDGHPLGVERALELYGAAKNWFVESVAEIGAPFVDAPPEAYNERGLLREEYWSRAENDFTHGNLVYGRLLIERLKGHFKDVDAL